MKTIFTILMGLTLVKSQCADDETAVGDDTNYLCLTDEEAQACHDHLDNLEFSTDDWTSTSDEVIRFEEVNNNSFINTGDYSWFVDVTTLNGCKQACIDTDCSFYVWEIWDVSTYCSISYFSGDPSQEEIVNCDQYDIICFSETMTKSVEVDGESDNTTSSISNICEDYVINDRQQYNFTITYNDPYYHNEDCLTQEVNFQEVSLSEGTADYDEWEFNSDDQTLKWSILHDDIDGLKYHCDLTTNVESYLWQCAMDLDIKLGGVVQLNYAFYIHITLDRVYNNTLDLTVEKNQVVGDCCENTLNIQTTLKFCTTYDCDAYLDDGLTVQRQEDVYVEHAISTPEFNYYFLHGLQLKLGAFVPEIIAWNGSEAGRIIYHFQSNIALPNMVLEAISRIDEWTDEGELFDTIENDIGPDRRMLTNAGSSRRRLQADGNEALGDDYKVKGVNQITVADDETQSSSILQIALLLLITLVCIVV